MNLVLRPDGLWLEFDNGVINLDLMADARGPLVRSAYYEARSRIVGVRCDECGAEFIIDPLKFEGYAICPNGDRTLIYKDL